MNRKSAGNANVVKGDRQINLTIQTTNGICPAGEKAGSIFIKEGRIPVLSCEGPCIRGEIAILARLKSHRGEVPCSESAGKCGD